MLVSALLSACNFDEVNIAISHQFTILALVLATGNLHGQTIVHQAFQLTADAACLTLVTKADVNILLGERIRQATITYPSLLLMCTT